MTATGINSWDEAVLSMPGSFEEIAMNGAHGGKGADANLYTMTMKGRTLTPDYHADRHVTHYFRLKFENSDATRSIEGSETMLRELMQLAESRIGEQEAWQKQSTHVSDDAPWAKNGYSRMKELYEKAKMLLKEDKAHINKVEMSQIAIALSTIINTMRPGNLPELEDLDELNTLLVKVRNSRGAMTTDRQKAIEYAEMVVRYVSDGSGTRDMIERAIRQLNESGY